MINFYLFTLLIEKDLWSLNLSMFSLFLKDNIINIYLWKIDYFLFYENNFYYWINKNNQYLIIEILPEIILVFLIFYNLINIFNDKKVPIFQYYKWVMYFIFILLLLIIKFNLSDYSISELFLGFSWMNSYYIAVSKILILVLTLSVLLISKRKIQQFLKLDYFIEFPLVIAFSVLFMFLLLSSYDFFGTYLSIEGLSLTLYVLSALLHQGIISVESAIKYFSLGAISSGSLLFGIVMLFGVIGSLDFLEIQNFLGGKNGLNYIFEIKISLVLIFFAFFFKISAFPCHVWIADVYEGIWSPITAFFAIVIKTCLIIFFIRLIFDVFLNVLIFFQPIFILVSLGSIIIGSFGALKQVRIKRFLAYTSISQVGFIFLGITSGTILGLYASIVYIILYLTMNLIFFAIFLNIEHNIFKKNIVYLSDLYSLNSYSNESGKFLSLTILSMAGLPPMGGFFGKLFLYFAIIEVHFDLILMISLIMSLISTYYYLNFVRYIFFEKHLKIKFYYYVKTFELTFFLGLLSSFLITFPIFFPIFADFILKLSFSCTWPFIFF